MSKNVAVVLSGCGVFDGAEIYETVLTLLALEEAGAKVSVFAPDMEQHHVLDHTKGEPMEQTRNVLQEASRIVRGDISALSDAKADNFDALILPGGFGVAKNLSDFAFNGADLTVNPELKVLARTFKEQQKPVGLMCIAPVLTAAIFGEGATCTVGGDKDVSDAINATGAKAVACPVDDIVVDETNKLVTTPAYMLAEKITDAKKGIDKLVAKVLQLA